jgi:hypothetical protein
MVARRSAQSVSVIVSLHVATGGALGAVAGSPGRAAVLGAVAHALGDHIPHEDIPSHRYELLTGAAALLAVALRHGPFGPATVGAFAGSVPDIEHIVRLPRPKGRKLFPSHRIPGFHRSGGISARAQLLVAGLLLGTVLAPKGRD